MGMGDPLLNYNGVCNAINTIISHTTLGPHNITVSTIGLKQPMEKLLSDPLWPKVRFAVSLHSAIDRVRQKLVPTTKDHASFLLFLKKWSKEYFKRFNHRQQRLCYECVLLKGINDDSKNAQALLEFCKEVYDIRLRVNLIPFNTTNDQLISPSRKTIEAFQNTLRNGGIHCFIRKSKGQNIKAACGQLVFSK